MPSKSSGKKIVKLKTSKKNVTLFFDDSSKKTFSKEVLGNFYIYEGKTIDNKTLKKIEEFNSSITLLNYAMSIIKKGHVSEWKMREKLYNKEAKKKDVDNVIKILKSHDLINDKMLILDTIEYGNERNIGKNKIVQDLLNKGLFKENIHENYFSYSLEKKKAINNIAKLEKKYDRYSYEQKRQHIYSSLLSLGFDNDVAIEALNHISKPNDKKEKMKLERDFNKTYIHYKNKYEGYDLKNKVVTSLRNKGYKVNEILREWEKQYGENDC